MRTRWLQKFRSNISGNVLMTFSLAAPVIFGAVAAAVDYTSFATERTRLQAAADAAALNAARELSSTNPSMIADVAANYAMAMLGANRSTATVQTRLIIPDSVEVRISEDLQPILSRVLSNTTTHVAVSAVAKMYIGAPLCMLGLDPTAANTVQLQQSGRMTAINCGVSSNSNSPKGLASQDLAVLAAAAARLLFDFARRRLGPLGLLELGLASAAVAPFLLRTTPIFGGIKHWLVLPALLAPEAASLLVDLSLLAAQPPGAGSALRWLTAPRAIALGACAALAPGLYQMAHVHPYGTSAYGELAGGIPGAASLGMQRQYWSNNVTAVLPWLNRNAPPGARVFFHEVNYESYRAYQMSGWLRGDLAYASGPEDADYAAIQWHREFRDQEPRVWNAFGTRRPAAGLYLDEVPQVVVYARPGLPGAP